jgi:hypothetical protein
MQQITTIIDKNGISFFDHGGYESRNSSTIHLIQQAWEMYPPKEPITKRIEIHTGDKFSSNCDFSYGVCSKSDIPRSFPSFIFDSWKQVGIEDYASTFDSMISAGSMEPTDMRAFWIGANMNSLREKCCQEFSQFPQHFDFRLMSWNRKDPNSLHTNTSTYVSLVDHCKYRVLADLGAGGFSARLPLLIASGRPVVLADRNVESWFYWDLQPWVHYIPGGSTPKSIFDAVQWTFAHPTEANRIGENGRAYAQEHLTRDAVIKRCANLLWNN